MSAPRSKCGNFFENIPEKGKDEVFDELVKDENVLVERIVSEGHISSEWYDQEENEFCSILRGAADLLFEGKEHPVRMNPGAWVLIPAHAKHKVTWTAPNEPTVWIAVKWKGSNGTDHSTAGS